MTVAALARFQMSGYVRSLRALQPLIVVLLFLCLFLLQWPSGSDPARLATGTLGDVAAFMFPVWAWAARSLLDTQPDEQRALSATAARHRLAPAVAGLLAAYLTNAGLAALVLVVPLIQCHSAGTGTGPMLAGVGLSLLAALAGTLLGAYTARSVIPSPGVSLLTLLGTVTAALLLGLGPADVLAVPMIEWLRAAHDGPSAFTTAFPGIAVHLLLWSAALATGHLLLARRPR